MLPLAVLSKAAPLLSNVPPSSWICASLRARPASTSSLAPLPAAITPLPLWANVPAKVSVPPRACNTPVLCTSLPTRPWPSICPLLLSTPPTSVAALDDNWIWPLLLKAWLTRVVPASTSSAPALLKLALMLPRPSTVPPAALAKLPLPLRVALLSCRLP